MRKLLAIFDKLLSFTLIFFAISIIYVGGVPKDFFTLLMVIGLLFGGIRLLWLSTRIYI